MVAGGIKIAFGLMLAALYALVAQTMIAGARGTPGYVPNGATDWIVTVTGGGLLAFVAAQIGVVIATPSAGTRRSLQISMFGPNAALEDEKEKQVTTATLVVLIVDVVVLVVAGAFFIWLYVKPEGIAVKDGAEPLREAPDYVALQAKAIIGLVLAGAGGIGVAAASTR